MTENTVSSGKVPARTERDLPATREPRRYMSPAVDIYETDEALVVLADVPGVDKDDLEVNVEDKILTIQGQVRISRPSETSSTEFALMDYFRQFRLSEEVDQTKIEANLERGVLRLRLPKAEHAKPRRISVRAG